MQIKNGISIWQQLCHPIVGSSQEGEVYDTSKIGMLAEANAVPTWAHPLVPGASRTTMLKEHLEATKKVEEFRSQNDGDDAFKAAPYQRRVEQIERTFAEREKVATFLEDLAASIRQGAD